VVPITNHMKAPRAVTGDQTIRMEATGVTVVGLTKNLTKAPRAAMVNPRTNRTGTLRAATDGLTTLLGAFVAVMVNRMTTATVDPIIPTGAVLPVVVDRMIPLTEAVKKALTDLAITTALTPMVDRRSAAAVDMAVLEAAVPRGTMTIRLTALAVIIRDINPPISHRISHRRTPIPLATPPLVIPTLGEVTVGVVRRKPVTTPRVATEALIILMAATKEAVAVGMATVMATARKVTIKSTTTVTTMRPMVLRS